MRVGDLVKIEGGSYGTIVREQYACRFISSTVDRDMIDGGMGHLAGSYGSAIDVVHHKTGERLRHRVSSKSFEVIND